MNISTKQSRWVTPCDICSKFTEWVEIPIKCSSKYCIEENTSIVLCCWCKPSIEYNKLKCRRCVLEGEPTLSCGCYCH